MRRLALLAGLVGCGADNRGPLTVDQLASAETSAYCDILVRCHLVDDYATCRTLDLGPSVDPSVVAAVHAGTVLFNADKARACVTGIESWTCDRTVAFKSRWTPPECSEIFGGTIGAMGTCAIGAECASQVCNLTTCPTTCCQGTCIGAAPPVHPRLGDPCAGASSCANSYCDPNFLTCLALLPVGAACMTTTQCAEGLTCSGTCQESLALGAACSGLCGDLGAYCSPTTSTCVAVGLSGAHCTTTAQCSALYTCNGTGTCALRPRLGDACTGTSSCIDHSFCDATTTVCASPKADGQSCMVARECSSNHCDSAGTQTCTTPAVCF